jgi:hypothetical protein
MEKWTLNSKEMLYVVKMIIQHGAAPKETQPIKYNELLVKAQAEGISQEQVNATLKALEATKQVERLKGAYRLAKE